MVVLLSSCVSFVTCSPRSCCVLPCLLLVHTDAYIRTGCIHFLCVEKQQRSFFWVKVKVRVGLGLGLRFVFPPPPVFLSITPLERSSQCVLSVSSLVLTLFCFVLFC
jgi:hypothetical protein